MDTSVFKSVYFYLLVLLIVFFIVNPFLTENRLSNCLLCFFWGLIIFFSIYAVSHNLPFTLLTAFIAFFSFATYWYTIWVEATKTTYLIHFVTNIIFLSIITYSVIVSVIKRRQITAHSLFGAICGYLLIGFTWSFLYLAIATIEPTAFSINLNHEGMRPRIDHFIYYSFVTLTTTGYGDILATNSISRTFSWMEAAVGQIYLAVWISQLVGLNILNHMKNKGSTL